MGFRGHRDHAAGKHNGAQGDGPGDAPDHSQAKGPTLRSALGKRSALAAIDGGGVAIGSGTHADESGRGVKEPGNGSVGAP
jgi:hypothetical protein